MSHSSNSLHKFPSEAELVDHHDEIKAKLFEKYKRAKAARLLGFWLHVYTIGIDAAKKAYGRSPFYAAQADLKAAGVELSKVAPKTVETSPVELTENAPPDNSYVRRFYLQISNPYATFREPGSKMRKVDPNDLWLDEWVEAIYWRDGKRYRYYPGDVCRYDPKSKAKEAEKFRGREVEILWMSPKLEKVAIKFLDTGKEGRAYPWDLFVIKRKAVDFIKYKETGEHRSLEDGPEVSPLPIAPNQRR